MRVYPVDFIDNAWYDTKNKQIEELHKMYEGIKGYLESIKELNETTNNQLSSLENEINNVNAKVIINKSEVDKALSDIVDSIKNLKANSDKQTSMFETYIKQHEEVHTENHSILDNLFGLFRKK